MLHDLIAAARTAWPDVQEDEEAFRAFLTAKAARFEETLHVGDLYLAFACMRRNVAALRHLDREMFAPVRSELQRRYGETTADDALSQLRERLLVGDGLLASYGGRGPLRGWIAISAMRDALKLLPTSVNEALDDRLAGQLDDLDIALVRTRYKAQFEQALSQAIESLEHRDRLLLKMSYLDGLSIDKVGALFHVPRATAARWIQAARDRVRDGTKERLRTLLRVDTTDLDSLFRIMHATIEISLRRVLITST